MELRVWEGEIFPALHSTVDETLSIPFHVHFIINSHSLMRSVCSECLAVTVSSYMHTNFSIISLRGFAVALIDAEYYQQQDTGVQYESQDKGHHHGNDSVICFTASN